MYDDSLGQEYAIYPTEDSLTLDHQAVMILDRINQIVYSTVPVPYEFIIFAKTDGFSNYRLYYLYDGSGQELEGEVVIRDPETSVVIEGPFFDFDPTSFGFAGLMAVKFISMINTHMT